MNKKLNNRPGFTAEASLNETSDNYRLGRTFVSVKESVQLASTNCVNDCMGDCLVTGWPILKCLGICLRQCHGQSQ